jgi:hypothetical protein
MNKILNKIKEIFGLQPKEVEWTYLKDVEESSADAYLRALNDLHKQMVKSSEEIMAAFGELKNAFK